VRKLNPKLRLDGFTLSQVKAAYRVELTHQPSAADRQRQQMMNRDSATTSKPSWQAAREKKMRRMEGKK